MQEASTYYLYRENGFCVLHRQEADGSFFLFRACAASTTLQRKAFSQTIKASQYNLKNCKEA